MKPREEINFHDLGNGAIGILEVEIVRLYADLAGLTEQLAQSERALEATRAKLRRIESTVRDWADGHASPDRLSCPTCAALHRIARGET